MSKAYLEAYKCKTTWFDGLFYIHVEGPHCGTLEVSGKSEAEAVLELLVLLDELQDIEDRLRTRSPES